MVLNHCCQITCYRDLDDILLNIAGKGIRVRHSLLWETQIEFRLDTTRTIVYLFDKYNWNRQVKTASDRLLHCV